MAGIYVALLRGINVGGKNKLPMKELGALFEHIGCRDVRTYIQSGNVVFEADGARAPGVPEDARHQIMERFGYDVPVVLRPAAELRAVVEGNPFLADDPDPKHLHVGFLADKPTSEDTAKLDPSRSDTDSFTVVGSEVYLHVPGGMGRTKLTTDWFDRRLGTVMTVRNWRTVNALLEMTGEAP